MRRYYVHGVSYVDERLRMMQLNHPSVNRDVYRFPG